MQNRVLIIQNSHEGPGIIIQVLQEKQIEYDLIKLDAGDIFPSPLNYRAVFILGGPDSANDQTNKMLDELAKIQEALDNNIPILGICLGCQILVKLVGGNVVPGNEPEIGLRAPDGNLYHVARTEAGKNDALFEGIGEILKVFELHGEVIELIPEIQLLATGSFVKNQIVKVADKSYGILCHCEIIPEELYDWFLIDPMLDAVDKEELMKEFKNIQPEYHRNGKILFSNFLRIAGL